MFCWQQTTTLWVNTRTYAMIAVNIHQYWGHSQHLDLAQSMLYSYLNAHRTGYDKGMQRVISEKIWVPKCYWDSYDFTTQASIKDGHNVTCAFRHQLKEYYQIANQARLCQHFFPQTLIFLQKWMSNDETISNLPSFRAIRALIASQSTFEI